VTSDFIHRGDYLTRHSIEARSDPVLCQRCHGISFCTACHNQENVGPGGSNPRRPHPPGWALPGPTSHAVAARRDIVSCASCHDQGPNSNCVGCHKVGGVGGNGGRSTAWPRRTAPRCVSTVTSRNGNPQRVRFALRPRTCHPHRARFARPRHPLPRSGSGGQSPPAPTRSWEP
jgi:hypothetical protein